MKKKNVFLSYFLICVYAALSALNYKLLVFPNRFAPSGVDGICTMIQYLLGVNIGYLSLIANVPLLIAAYFIVDKTFAKKTCAYVFAFAFASVLLSYIDLSRFLYKTTTGTSTVLAPLAAGVIRGGLYVVTLKENGSSGGTDIVAKIVSKYKPHYNLMSIVFVLNCAIAFASYFVYGFALEPVICSVVYSFVTSSVTTHIQISKQETIKFEIITSTAEKLCEDISKRLRQTATVVEAHGAYSGKNKKMVVCITEKRNAPKLEEIVKEFPDAVTFESVVNHSIYPNR